MINTSFIDQKYITYLSSRLKNFRNKGNGLYEFSHTCETSNRRRGYFYKKGNGYNFFCHNCNESQKFFNFLKQQDPYLYDQYNVELFVNDKDKDSRPAPKVKVEQVVEEKTFEFEGLEAAEDHPIAVNFLKQRKIPEERWNEILFCEDFFTWASSFYEKFKELKQKQPRLIIPYLNKNEEIFGFTCRAFDNSKPKYIELKVSEDADMIYGLNHITTSKKIYAVEGPIDSMFLPNCIAVGGAAYTGEFVNKYKSNIVIVPDNDWKRNKEVCEQVLKMAEKGFSMSLFPDNLKFKDINEAIINGYSPSDLKKVIDNNVKSGTDLILDITFRRKC